MNSVFAQVQLASSLSRKHTVMTRCFRRYFFPWNIKVTNSGFFRIKLRLHDCKWSLRVYTHLFTQIPRFDQNKYNKWTNIFNDIFFVVWSTSSFDLDPRGYCPFEIVYTVILTFLHSDVELFNTLFKFWDLRKLYQGSTVLCVPVVWALFLTNTKAFKRELDTVKATPKLANLITECMPSLSGHWYVRTFAVSKLRGIPFCHSLRHFRRRQAAGKQFDNGRDRVCLTTEKVCSVWC